MKNINCEEISKIKKERDRLDNIIADFKKKDIEDRKTLKDKACRALGEFLLKLIGKPWYCINWVDVRLILINIRSELYDLEQDRSFAVEKLREIKNLKSGLGRMTTSKTKSKTNKVVNKNANEKFIADE